jgi:hypothetical protein
VLPPVVEPVVAGVIAGVVAGVILVAGLVLFVDELLVVELFASGPGQAAPIKPKTKTAERAKVFFICICILLSSSKINYICSCFYTALFPQLIVKLITGTLDNIKT